MDAKEYYEQLLKRQLSFLNISEYHSLGYKGQGITILNAESFPGADGHGEMTTGVINDYAPESTVINSVIGGSTSGNKVIDTYLIINSSKIDFEEAIDKYGIKIITSSHSNGNNSARNGYMKDVQKRKGIIMISSAGNYADDGVTGTYTKDDTAIAVGAAQIKENGIVERMYYSSTGPELDFMCFTGRGSGTSAASPALASMGALLLQRYGDFNQQECVEILKSLCIDLGVTGRDDSFGYGLPVLPLTDKLEILERLRGGNMEFKDVNDTDWFKNAVDFCTEQGTLQGFPDGTFKPNEPLTRAQYAQAEYNKAKKEGRI